MGRKTKLEQAIDEQSEHLTDAQREIVSAQYSLYKKNRAEIARIDSELRRLSSTLPVDREELRYRQAQRTSLSYERNQLATANSRIAADLFEFMKERP